MYIRSARPPLLSSASKACRYSTDTPTPTRPRPLLTEFKGISIPSLTELKEQARIREEKAKKPLDISYLKDAPKGSLAGRLAADLIIPNPKPAPRSQEEIDSITEKRREARVARQSAKANEILKGYKPSATLEKYVATRGNGVVQPQKNDPRPRTPHIIQPETLQAENFSQGALEKSKEASTKNKADRDPLLVQLEESTEDNGFRNYPSSGRNDSDNRRERKTAALDKKREIRDRKQRLLEEEFGDTKDRKAARTSSAGNLTPTQLQAIEKRRQLRLLRESEKSTRFEKKQSRAANSVNTQAQKTSAKKQVTSVKKQATSAKKQATSPKKQAQSEEEDDTAYYLEEDLISASVTGPEPVSITLMELFVKSPTLQVPRTTPNLVSDYSHSVSRPTAALFSKPVDKLSAVDLAKVTLSHREDITLQQRHQAISTISMAMSLHALRREVAAPNEGAAVNKAKR